MLPFVAEWSLEAVMTDDERMRGSASIWAGVLPECRESENGQRWQARDRRNLHIALESTAATV